MSGKLTLGYWGIRGRGQVTRLVCAYTGVEWEQKTYFSPEEWFGEDKQQLGILFPNLPYIVDGDVKISESDILPRYVVKKSQKLQLLGRDAKDMALVDNVIYVVLDLWSPMNQLFFNKKWEDEKTGVFYQLKAKLARLQKFINNKQTTLGYLTLADFFISEFSFYVQKLFPEQYSKFKSLQKIRNTIESLQQVRKYYSQPGAVQAAFLPPNITVVPFFLQKLQPKNQPPVTLVSTSSPKKQQKVKEQVINNGQKLRVILMSGSLRKLSLNSALLKACVQLNNPNIQFQWADISDIPIFNQDIQQQGVPESVQRVRNQVQKAHAILFGVTENNSAPSAALKNAYDWLSRGGEKASIYKIPAGMVSVGGDMGGLRAQKALRLIGAYCQVKFMEGPQIAIKRYQAKYFDQEGNLEDEKTREKLKTYLQSLCLWIDKHKKH